MVKEEIRPEKYDNLVSKGTKGDRIVLMRSFH